TRRFPPFLFVTTAVKIAMMHSAQGHEELVAYPATKSARLPKSEVMRVGRPPAADQAGLRTNKLTMRLITLADQFQKWCRRFSIDYCKPLGDIRCRAIVVRQSTPRVGSVLIALFFGLLELSGASQIRAAIQHL